MKDFVRQHLQQSPIRDPYSTATLSSFAIGIVFDLVIAQEWIWKR